jgi:hypothetical protein
MATAAALLSFPENLGCFLAHGGIAVLQAFGKQFERLGGRKLLRNAQAPRPKIFVLTGERLGQRLAGRQFGAPQSRGRTLPTVR